MKKILKLGFLAWAISFSGSLAAQEIQTQEIVPPDTARSESDLPDANLLRYYDAELFQWSYSMFGGLVLNFQNQSSITPFGLKDTMRDALIRYEDAYRQYRSYRGKTIAGNILLWGGLGAVMGGFVYAAVVSARPTPMEDSGGFTDANIDKQFQVSLGFMVGGLITEIIGAFILQSGQENIFNAVHLYNRQRINAYR
jgi:hypothetical protein